MELNLEIYLIIYVLCGPQKDGAGRPPRPSLAGLARFPLLIFSGQSAQGDRDAVAPRKLQDESWPLPAPKGSIPALSLSATPKSVFSASFKGLPSCCRFPPRRICGSSRLSSAGGIRDRRFRRRCRAGRSPP